MNIENDIFNKYVIDKDKLLDYGFIKENKILIYKTNILNNSFEVIITYDNKINGKIIDLSFNEEYTNFRNTIIGEFSSKVKFEYENILIDIRNKCSNKRLFIYDQTNRINDYMVNTLHTNPEFPWKEYDHAVYRCDNNKWFALTMSIPFNKVDKTSKDESLVEVMNVKIDTLKKEKLLKINGLYEAYHMNKKSWITIILNDTLKDKDIIKLINDSYNLVK